MLLVVILVVVVLEASALCHQPKILEEYDFIVVGAGAAGCVVASRLSEQNSASVLLLEAGGDEGLILMAPLSVAVTAVEVWDWGYRAELDPNACRGTSDKRCPMPRGKVMGGTTAINLMVYTRGSPRDYDNWEALGNPGWSYKDVLPYFLKSEDQTNPEYVNSPYHSTKGPVTVSTANYHTPISDAYLEAASYLGYPIRDINGESPSGFSRSQGMVRDGRRLSSNRAFLNTTVRKRPNLTISLHSRVDHLLMKGNEVIGVEFQRKDEVFKVMARKEVVVCAGAFNSPKILMLSGIGPKDHLENLRIPVVKNLSVGLNLQDHFGVSHLVFELDESIESLGEDAIYDLESVLQWLDGDGGPLSVPGSCEAVGYLSSSLNKYGQDWPDMEIYMQGTTTNPAASVGFWLADDNPPKEYDAISLPERGKPAISLIPCVLRPKSKGVVRLRSKDPKDPPHIYNRFYSEPDDMKIILEAIKVILKIIDTPVFKKMGAKLNSTYAPGCQDFKFGSNEFWECWAKTYTALFYHPSCTCKMGPASDPEAVVDSRLKVHGISKLRVCDTSIAPREPSCHTTAPAIMIGEKCADMIKQDHGYATECSKCDK